MEYHKPSDMNIATRKGDIDALNKLNTLGNICYNNANIVEDIWEGTQKNPKIIQWWLDFCKRNEIALNSSSFIGNVVWDDLSVSIDPIVELEWWHDICKKNEISFRFYPVDILEQSEKIIGWFKGKNLIDNYMITKYAVRGYKYDWDSMLTDLNGIQSRMRWQTPALDLTTTSCEVTRWQTPALDLTTTSCEVTRFGSDDVVDNYFDYKDIDQNN
jgi:hypothetical protein